MGQFVHDVLLSLAWIPFFVAAGFLALFLSKKYKITWLTNFLTQPSEHRRPPGWIVFAGCALLLIFTLAWFLLPTERQSTLRQFIVGPMVTEK
ncbi:MAG: hypothetical protein IPJ84_19935 [Bdellovibrionales bacterium]|nr:hypothetical protein [Bdellovibrionales bacterium]